MCSDWFDMCKLAVSQLNSVIFTAAKWPYLSVTSIYSHYFVIKIAGLHRQ